MPVISAATQSRGEGYFRLEWKLAVDRSYLMADDAPFLFPVVIDAIPDATARVPDKFREVQWTRLDPWKLPAEFSARVTRLLAGDATVASWQRSGAEGSALSRPRHPVTSWLKLIMPLAGIIFAIVYTLRSTWTVAGRNDRKTARPAQEVTAPATSEARQLAMKARAMSLDKYNSTADDFATAEGWLKRAVELDANDGEIWAIYSQFHTAIRTRGFDEGTSRREDARADAERALKLAPDSVEARFALGRWQRDNDPDRTLAEQSFKAVLAQAPDHVGALLSLGTLYARQDRFEAAIAMFERIGPTSPSRPLALYSEFLAYFGRSHFAEAERCIRESIALEPSSNSVAGLAMLLLTSRGDGVGAIDALAGAPKANRNEHRIIWIGAFAELVAHRPEEALLILQRHSSDFIRDNWYVGPKAYWVGRAQLQAGRPEAARVAFEAGLAVTETRLKAMPENRELLVIYGELLAHLGRSDEAMRVARTVEELGGAEAPYWMANQARIYAVLGRADDAMPLLAKIVLPASHVNYGWPLTPALLRIDPLWEKLRDDPRFKALAEGK